MGFFEYDSDDIAQTIEQWQATGTTEEECEESLGKYLNQKFEKPVFHRQFTIGKSRADIYVRFPGGASVAIELKSNLTERTEFQRLIGQMYEYLNVSDVELVVVLCGDGNPALEKMVRDAVAFFNEHHEKKVRYVKKGVTALSVN